jgi:hypothetical protein
LTVIPVVLIIAVLIGASMPDFSHVIPESHQNVSARVLETLFQTQREASFTGLMRLNYFPGENLIFSFLEGKQEKLYRCHDGAVEILPRQDWQDALERDCDFVGLLPLPVEGMRFMRVSHEAPIHHVQRSNLPGAELTKVVENWAAAPEPGIVHIWSDTINRYYLVAGHSTPVMEELSVLGGEVRFSLNDASFPKSLPSREYQVVRYVSGHEHDVWREYELRLAFHPFMRMLLNRFSELAGRVLTERLCGQLSLWAHEAGWHITLTSNGILNRHYFDSVESAIGFYVELMRRFNAEASPALGSRMTEGISQEILMKLDSQRYDLLAKSIFSWLGAGGGTGGAWR